MRSMVRILSEKPEKGIHIQRNPIHVEALPLFSRHLTGKIDGYTIRGI